VQGEFLLSELQKMEQEFPDIIGQSRGRGLICAFSLEEAQNRNVLKQKCYDQGLILLGCGDRSIRFRTALNVTREELDEGLQIIRSQLVAIRNRDF
jgi:L-lysine 6-transaminase